MLAISKKSHLEETLSSAKILISFTQVLFVYDASSSSFKVSVLCQTLSELYGKMMNSLNIYRCSCYTSPVSIIFCYEVLNKTSDFGNIAESFLSKYLKANVTNFWNYQLHKLMFWPVSYTHLDVYKRQTLFR